MEDHLPAATVMLGYSGGMVLYLNEWDELVIMYGVTPISPKELLFPTFPN